MKTRIFFGALIGQVLAYLLAFVFHSSLIDHQILAAIYTILSVCYIIRCARLDKDEIRNLHFYTFPIALAVLLEFAGIAGMILTQEYEILEGMAFLMIYMYYYGIVNFMMLPLCFVIAEVVFTVKQSR